MAQSDAFIHRLESLQEGDLSRLRRLAGRSISDDLAGFDLFTGFWWPLREASQAAPRRETSWLVAKLFATFRIPHVRSPSCCLPVVLRMREPLKDTERERFRIRFDALLQAPLPAIEPHLRWALRESKQARVRGLHWAQLLYHLSIWDRPGAQKYPRDIRDVWARQYLNGNPQTNP